MGANTLKLASETCERAGMSLPAAIIYRDLELASSGARTAVDEAVRLGAFVLSSERER